MIDKMTIAATINKLRKAGKTMPQNDRLRNSSDLQKAAKDILQDTVELWAEIFGSREISVERWRQAEQTALVMTKADGLNVNIISPALMEEALKRCEAEYLEAQRVKYEAEKRQEQKVCADDYQTKTLWHWTVQRLSKAVAIMPDLPTEQELYELAQRLKLKGEAFYSNMKLLQIYIADRKHCRRCLAGKSCQNQCYLNHWCKQIAVENGKVRFSEAACNGSVS